MKRLAIGIVLLLTITVSGLVYLRTRSPTLPPPPTDAELQALLDQRDALQKRLTETIVKHGENSVAKAPRGGVMIGIPTSFTRSIAEQIVTGLFNNMTLTLKNLKAHKDGEVRVKAVFGKKTVGKYILDVQIHQVQGVLQPGKPELTFSKDRIALKLKVKLTEGSGNADVRLQWDSKGLSANMICGSVDVTKAVTGGVVPQEYELGGAFNIKATGGAITLSPDFPEPLQVRIFVVPSEQAWKAVDEVIKERGAACEAILNKVDIKSILDKVVDKGFNVKIPQKVIKEVRLPAGLNQSLEIQGIKLALDIKPSGLLVSGDRLWYGADISLNSPGNKTPKK